MISNLYKYVSLSSYSISSDIGQAQPLKVTVRLNISSPHSNNKPKGANASETNQHKLHCVDTERFKSVFKHFAIPPLIIKVASLVVQGAGMLPLS